jgi:hypothetical protein
LTAIGGKRRVIASQLSPIFRRLFSVINFGSQEKLLNILYSSSNRYEEKVNIDIKYIDIKYFSLLTSDSLDYFKYSLLILLAFH